MEDREGLTDDIASWRENVMKDDSYKLHNENEKESQENNNKRLKLLTISFKILLTLVLTILLWMVYLVIVAMFIPVEAEITDAQGWTSALIAFITALIIVLKIKPNRK